jgi:hypothetical protein
LDKSKQEKWPSINDPPKKTPSTPVKYFPGLGYAPVREARKLKGKYGNAFKDPFG